MISPLFDKWVMEVVNQEHYVLPIHFKRAALIDGLQLSQEANGHRGHDGACLSPPTLSPASPRGSKYLMSLHPRVTSGTRSHPRYSIGGTSLDYKQDPMPLCHGVSPSGAIESQAPASFSELLNLLGIQHVISSLASSEARKCTPHQKVHTNNHEAMLCGRIQPAA